MSPQLNIYSLPQKPSKPHANLAGRHVGYWGGTCAASSPSARRSAASAAAFSAASFSVAASYAPRHNSTYTYYQTSNQYLPCLCATTAYLKLLVAN